jgi:hypothetical protein
MSAGLATRGTGGRCQWSGAKLVPAVLIPRPSRINGFDFGTSNSEIAPDRFAMQCSKL